VALLVVLVTVPASLALASDRLRDVRQATARYHSVKVAERAGYGLFYLTRQKRPSLN
jgi:hypothetical protein